MDALSQIDVSQRIKLKLTQSSFNRNRFTKLTRSSFNRNILVILSLLFPIINSHTLRSPIREGALDGLIVDSSNVPDSKEDAIAGGDKDQDQDKDKDQDRDQDQEKDDEEENKEEEKTYFCNHQASCGDRANPGPPTSDSTLSGYECYCRGEKQLGFAAFCYQGTCYDPSRDNYRTPEDLDEFGMCSYTLKTPADIEFCQNSESSEKTDPNLKSFTGTFLHQSFLSYIIAQY